MVCRRHDTVASVAADRYCLAPVSESFEDGTLNYAALPAVVFGLDLLETAGVDVVHTRLRCPHRLAARVPPRAAPRQRPAAGPPASRAIVGVRNGHRGKESMARVTSKGQVTIPVCIRRALDLEPGDDVVFELGPEGARLRKRVRLTDLYGALPATRPYPGKAAIREEVAEALGREYELGRDR